MKVCQEEEREGAGNKFNVLYNFIQGQPLQCIFLFYYQRTLSQTLRLLFDGVGEALFLEPEVLFRDSKVELGGI